MEMGDNAIGGTLLVSMSEVKDAVSYWMSDGASGDRANEWKKRY